MNYNCKISVLCPCYNHEKFVGQFIDSILKQTYQDFEIVIVDDCSKDNSINEIKKFGDNRIKLIQHDYNMGVNAALNTAFKNSNGDYIIFCASDDMVKPDYFQKINEIFSNNDNIGVIYSSLLLIDENNKKIKPQPNWCILKEEDKYTILNKLFYIWNVLFSPGMAIRRNIFKQIIPLDLSLVQHQDYCMHINLLLRTDLKILNKPYIYYRRISKATNLSAQNDKTHIREQLEMHRLMDTFLQIKDTSIIKKIFNLSDYKNLDNRLIPFYLGKEALNSQNKQKQEWGYKTIMNFLANEENFALLINTENFNFSSYLNLINIFEKELNKNKKNLKKYKKLFNLLLIIAIFLFFLLAFCVVAYVWFK